MAVSVIQVDQLWKEYRLGVINHHSLSRDLQTWWARMRGKEDPNSTVDSVADKGGDQTFWALQGVSFEVVQGDVLGIIGRNGAGKSTLLKILSQVTAPTKGEVRLKGRIASLLEVGTGFHPELTGLENIFLNGAILGMSKAEIRSKLDEIIAFAEVERFIDTPVKRYSSGMYVRLAFAVAAHLDPDILVVDEVLAVGDAQFQKKCVGKIEDAGRQGRTVLFVSHNMGAISQICNKCMILEKGTVSFHGDVRSAVSRYLTASKGQQKIDRSCFFGPLKSRIEFKEIEIHGSEVAGGDIAPSAEISIVVKGYCHGYIARFRTSIVLYKDGFRLCTLHDLTVPEPLSPGEIVSEVRIPPFFLRPGDYYIALGGHDGGVLASGTDWIFSNELASFTIVDEWSDRNDFANVGAINLPHAGFRRKGLAHGIG